MTGARKGCHKIEDSAQQPMVRFGHCVVMLIIYPLADFSFFRPLVFAAKEVRIDQHLRPGTRVTVRLNNPEASMSRCCCRCCCCSCASSSSCSYSGDFSFSSEKLVSYSPNRPS